MTLTDKKCKTFSKKDILRFFRKSEMLDLCEKKGITGVSRFNKSQLYDACCLGTSVSDIKEKRSESAFTRKIDVTRAQIEREKREREEARQRLMEKRTAYEQDIKSIQPDNLKKIKKKSDYKRIKPRERPTGGVLGLFANIGETFAGETPQETGYKKRPCPKTVEILADEIYDVSTRSYKENEVFDKLDDSYMKGLIVDRDTYEFVLVKDKRNTYEKVKENLSDEFKVRKCFDFERSSSGMLFGIFLKK